MMCILKKKREWNVRSPWERGSLAWLEREATLSILCPISRLPASDALKYITLFTKHGSWVCLAWDYITLFESSVRTTGEVDEQFGGKQKRKEICQGSTRGPARPRKASGARSLQAFTRLSRISQSIRKMSSWNWNLIYYCQKKKKVFLILFTRKLYKWPRLLKTLTSKICFQPKLVPSFTQSFD